MTGAIIGDIAGSRFEFNNHRSKDFEIFHKDSFFTDDTVMTIAVAFALMHHEGDLPQLTAHWMQRLGRFYPGLSYGNSFQSWIDGDIKGPYNSFGNGAAMRVSPCAWVAKSLDEAIQLSENVTAVTHNHPEGIKGAEAVTVATYMALHGANKKDIYRDMKEYYDLDFTIDEIRPKYGFDETCQGTVPVAIRAFYEADSFEDAIRTAVSVGGDSDTLAAITGSIAEAYWGVPTAMQYQALRKLDLPLRGMVLDFEHIYGNKLKG